MTAPAKRGRPKKAAENPDCEVATKGYVKCVVRSVHSVYNFDGCFMKAALADAVVMAAVALWAMMCNISPALVGLIIAIGIVFIAHDVFVSFMLFRTSSDMKCIQPHTEPPCERKKECDE